MMMMNVLCYACFLMFYESEKQFFICKLMFLTSMLPCDRVISTLLHSVLVHMKTYHMLDVQVGLDRG